jgi:hypothetical protein
VRDDADLQEVLEDVARAIRSAFDDILTTAAVGSDESIRALLRHRLSPAAGGRRYRGELRHGGVRAGDDRGRLVARADETPYQAKRRRAESVA